MKCGEDKANLLIILAHPYKHIISIAFMYSYHYRLVQDDLGMKDIKTRRMASSLALKQVIKILDGFLPIP